QGCIAVYLSRFKQGSSLCEMILKARFRNHFHAKDYCATALIEQISFARCPCGSHQAIFRDYQTEKEGFEPSRRY
ncbi:MAG: hypothetical protein IJ409_09630, partial [Lachnospiraceae bacterium]|nr:hypothetical protein [Lachnospiraceae bacterium]